MQFIKLAVTRYEPDRAKPAIGADDIWINLDQVVSIEEHLGSNSFEEAVRTGHTPEEHYPCVQLSMSNGRTYLVPLGTYTDQLRGFDAIARFMPALLRPSGSSSEELLDELPTETHLR